MKHRVLIIVENLPVPFDTRVWKEAKSLYKHGFEVTVLCPRGRNFSAGYQLLDGIHIYRHPMPAEGDGLWGYIMEYSAALAWEMLYAWWIFVRRGFDIVQGCNPPDTIVFVALPFKLFGVQYIFDHHDANPELYLSKYGKKGLVYRAQQWLEQVTFCGSDVVMSTNASYRDLATTRGQVSPEDAFVVRNGPDLDTFKPVAPNPAWKKGKPNLIGYVGTISVQEGLGLLIEVATRARDLGREDLHFVCVGGGTGLKAVQALAVEKRVNDLFTFTGRIPDTQLIDCLSTADVCVNPDTPCEMNNISTMIKIMEYMALGKPIVQFDLKEGKVSAGEASLYARADDRINDFTAKLLWLIDHPDERKRMGAIGRHRVEDALAWKYSEENLLAAYKRALAKRRRSSEAVGPTLAAKR